MLAVGMVGLMAFGALMAFVPVASAAVHVTVNPDRTRDTVMRSSSVEFTVTVTWTYDEADLQRIGGTISNSEVKVTPVSTKDWAIPIASPATQTVPGDKNTASFKLLVNAKEMPPAHDLAEITIPVHVKTTGAGTLEGDGSEKVMVEAAYFANVQTSFPSSIVQATPGTPQKVSVNIKNTGNGRSNVFLTLSAPPSGWSVSLSETKFEIGSAALGLKDTYTVYINILTPEKFGYKNELSTITITAKMESTDKARDPDTMTVTSQLTVKLKGFSIPGFDAVIMLGAIGTVALLMKKKK